MTDDDLYRLLVVRGYPQHEAAHIAAGPHSPPPDFDTAVAALKEIAKGDTLEPAYAFVKGARAALDALGVEWGK